MTSSEELRFTKINELPGISDIHDDDTFIIENTNATYKLSGSALIQYIKNHNDIRDTYIESNKVGTGNGIAPLDPNKKIDSDYLLFGKTSGSIYDGAEGALLEKQLLNHTGNTDNPHQIDKSKIGLDQVENKSSETIRSEITYKNITNALGYVPGNSGVIYYSECSADASDPDKIVSCPGFELFTGASIKIKFNKANTAEHPTLNINHSGSIPVTYTGIGKDITMMWNSGEVIDLIFDGTQYLITDSGLASVQEYGITKLTDGVASTSTDTAATPASVKKAYDLAADAVDLISVHKSGSDHDDRYYTESEINNLLAGKLSTSASCNKNWNWSGQSGQPAWVWGSSDGENMYVYNPSNFNVANADNAGFASLAGAVAWDKVTNKPGSYPPSPHTHDYLPAAGGIIAGNLQINGGISSNSYYTKDPGATMKIVATNYINLQANGSIQARNHDDTGWVGMSALGFYNQSSQRYKEHIQDMSEETAKEILQLRPVTYDYKNKNDGTNCLGLIAEEVAQIEKYPVSYNADGKVDGLDYSKFIPQLIKMVQMMQKEINELKKQIN